MNIYKALNELTEYIENNLENNISYKKLSKIIGVNEYTMQRLFSLLTNISLSEYIRKRRLSNAGYDLYNSKEKIIDIALKYQYENATSFSRAFEKFHGIKPSKVNKTTKLKNFPRIIFDENIKIQSTIDYEIIKLNKLELYGKGIKTNNKNIPKDAPELFKKLKKYENILGRVKYGMVVYKDDLRTECSNYYCLYDKYLEGFEKIEIPASKWLVFKINSNEAKDIQELSHKFYLEFLPSCKFNLKDLPELEYYHDNITEFLVAIQ